MKLSEKLAALEHEDARDTAPAPAAPVGTKRVRPLKSRGATNWDANKRKVRDLVMDEVAPKMGGLVGEALAAEVKKALDTILQREDVQVTPLERRRFVQEVMSDTLGYGPLDPLLADETVTEVMCNSYDDIWVEREGRIEATELSFTDDTPSSTRSSQPSVGASTRPRRWSTPGSPTAPASTRSSRRWPSTARC
jgi:hypothetical protein